MQLCKSLKNLSNNLIDPKNNKVFDYEKVSVSNEEMNALSIDKIKEAPKYSSAKSPSAIQLIHDNNDEVYYFEDNNGDKGVLVSYRPRASQAYYDRVVYSHNSLLYYISPIDTSKDLSNYYANYYLLDLKGIETIEDYFYDTENSQIGNKITKNNFPKDFTKLYLNYNSNKTLPEPLKNGISLTNITEVKNKIIEDNSK